MFTIRPVNPDDAAQICRIYNPFVINTDISFEVNPLTVRQMQARIALITESYPWFVAESANGRISGFCYAHRWKGLSAYARTLETTIYIEPEAKRQGIGRELMKALEKECRYRGCKALIACITSTNRESIYFHKSLGFIQVSAFTGVATKFDRPLDVTDLQLIL